MRYLLTLTLLIISFSFVAMPKSALAWNAFGYQTVDCRAISDESQSAVCQRGGVHNPVSGPHGILLKVADIIAFLGGAVAIIMLIVGSIKFMTAQGDPAKVASAKSTVYNSLIGLIIIALSNAILTFVVDKL